MNVASSPCFLEGRSKVKYQIIVWKKGETGNEANMNMYKHMYMYIVHEHLVTLVFILLILLLPTMYICTYISHPSLSRSPFPFSSPSLTLSPSPSLPHPLSLTLSPSLSLPHPLSLSPLLQIVECVCESLCIEETPLPMKLARLYLLNDILHNCTSYVHNSSAFRRG